MRLRDTYGRQMAAEDLRYIADRVEGDLDPRTLRDLLAALTIQARRILEYEEETR